MSGPITDQEVAWYAEEYGCSMLEARLELEHSQEPSDLRDEDEPTDYHYAGLDMADRMRQP